MKKILSSLFFFILSVSSLTAQVNPFKNDAIKEMKAGRLGEAIELLNRYISANPQESEGFNLRGLCFERRNQFEMAVEDFRIAKKLNPNNPEIIKNLLRATETFNQSLYSKIEGHKREIAISPKTPRNYLEIANSYKNLQQWTAAEDWYDKYLRMTEASADEILRYTDILNKNNHLSKAENILKKYSEKFPSDYRIISRYGYFLLWQGKSRQAVTEFQKALQIRPYYKEAMTGLDNAKTKSASINVTPKTEYGIDALIKQITANPELTEVRYSLINELIKNNRIEEAYTNLLYLQKTVEADSVRFLEKWKVVTEIKDSTNKEIVSKYASEFQQNSADKIIALKLSSAYVNLYDYDNAIDVLEKFLSNVDEQTELDIRFTLVKYAAWSYQWEKAFRNCDLLIKYAPENSEYQMMLSQLICWNVLDASKEDIEKAKLYLNNTLSKEPNKPEAIKMLAFLYAGIADFAEADKQIEHLQKLGESGPEIEALVNYYNTRKEIYKAKEVLLIREVCGKLFDEGKCKEAAEKYKEVFSKTESPSKELYSEFASFSNCAGNYQDAIDAYSKALVNEYDSDLIFLRAANRVLSGDTLTAVNELQDLYQKNPSDYLSIFNLGDLYEKIKRNDEAVFLYRKTLEDNKSQNFLDSAQVNVITTRLNYLDLKPTRSFKLLNGIGLSPSSIYYSDNKNLILYNYALKGDLNISSNFSLAGRYMKHYVKSSDAEIFLNSYTGFLQFNKGNFYASGGIGITKTLNNYKTGNYTFNLVFDRKKYYGISGNFEKNDSRVMLYSPFLIDSKIDVRAFRLNGYLNFQNNFYLYAYAGQLNISDNNKGNDFQLRAARESDKLKMGYEYYASSYTKTVNLYYSPESFQSHSLWGEYKLLQSENFNLTGTAKLGYVPASDYILSEMSLQIGYLPLSRLSINATISGGSTRQYNLTYNYLSGYLTAYWSIY